MGGGGEGESQQRRWGKVGRDTITGSQSPGPNEGQRERGRAIHVEALATSRQVTSVLPRPAS